MHLLLTIIIHTANILGSFNDPFEFQGDYGSDSNPTRNKVFDLVVANEALHPDDPEFVEFDRNYGPLLSEIYTPEIKAALFEKQTLLEKSGFTETDLKKILATTHKLSEKKIFYFLRHNPSDLLSMDKILRDKASREGKAFDLPILSSTKVLEGKDANTLSLALFDTLFTEEHLKSAKIEHVLTEAIDKLDSDYMKALFGEESSNQDLEAFTSPAGQVFFYWLYQSLNLHLVAQNPDLIEPINRVKNDFSQTLGDAQVRATLFKDKIAQAGTSVLFTQESDTLVPKALQQEGLFLPLKGQNVLDGTLVLLKTSDWNADYQVLPVADYEGFNKGRLNVVLATHLPTNKVFVLGSAHGNSTRPEDGRLQISLITALFNELKETYPDLQLLIGIDANTKTDQDVLDLHSHLDRLGLVGTSVGPTTIKQRMVTAQHSKAGHFAIDEEDFLITLKPENGGDYLFTDVTVGFSYDKPPIDQPLPNLNNLSDHYPVGATLQEIQ